MKPPKVKIERFWEQQSPHESIEDGDCQWLVRDLYRATENEPAFELPLAHIPLDTHDLTTKRGLISFARHMKHVMECDLSIPIIMSEYGTILDGRHRIVRALFEGKTTILAKRVPAGAEPSSYI